jgi:RimJ/RimL family protein N-acetyltransferase
MTSSAADATQSGLGAVLAGAETMELTLYEESGRPIGVMRPLTSQHLDQIDVMRKLTDWRNANMANFLTHFEATPERTRSWVQNVLLKNPGQMLWLVYDQNDDLVGHFGFKNLTSESVLLDNAMRGERQGHPKLFVFAGRRLVKWLWQATTVQRIDAYVMADNAPSIMMNRQIGFEGWKRHPLIKRSIEGNTHWYMGSEGQTSSDNRYCFNLWIERKANTSYSSAALDV